MPKVYIVCHHPDTDPDGTNMAAYDNLSAAVEHARRLNEDDGLSIFDLSIVELGVRRKFSWRRLHEVWRSVEEAEAMADGHQPESET